jgi:MFS family permease
MPRRQLTALILASALITLDGTATVIALPAIGRELSASMGRLQWIVNAPLLGLSAMLLPAGTLGDRFGHVRILRIGLIVFAIASAVCAAAPTDCAIIAARLAQGVGGALVLPSVLALLRAAYDDMEERTRIFGTWAAWTGAAAAVGPLLAGVFVDVVSWRAIFVTSASIGLAAALLLKRDAMTRIRERCQPIPAGAMTALVALLAAAAYALMEGARSGWTNAAVMLAAGIAMTCGVALARDPRLPVLLPSQLLNARNCVAANATDFSLYFGMFGLSFLLALYAQQVLRYSALWSAVTLLPISIMLLLAERFGRLTVVIGTKPLALGGALTAGAALAWIGSAPHPIPFWSHMILGTTVFGLGMSVSVSALTHASVTAVPEDCAGAASGLNHAVVRLAGLIAIAVLGSIATSDASDIVSAEGFRSAVLVCAAIVAGGGLAASAQLRDHEAGGVPSKA